MGGNSSKEERHRRMRSLPSSSSSTSSSSWNGQRTETYAPHQSYAPPQFDYYAAAPPPQGQGYGGGGRGQATDAPRLDRRYSKIADNYKSLDE
ncbi:hypothetical protein PanWU01x14_326740, partial [Parasponia andersonii]